jgi:ATP-dependent helicase/nuclease subunit B
LLYIQFSGGRRPGQLVDLPNVQALTTDAIEKLSARIRAFDQAETPYVSRVKPFRSDSIGDYDHLARVREWSLFGPDDEEPS